MTTRWVAPPSADLTKCSEEGVTGACGPGLSTNPGTQALPWSMAKACASAAAGDVVNIRGGTYNKENNPCSVVGTSSNRITFRGYPGAAGTFASREWPVFDGYIHTTLSANIGFTTTCTSGNTIQLTSGANFPADIANGISSVILVDEEWIRLEHKASANVYDGCSRNWSIGSPGILATHNSGAEVTLWGNRLEVTGNFLTFRDFQLTNSYARREWPTVFKSRGEGIFNFGSNNEFINLIIDNNEDGMFIQDGACNNLVYGIIFHSNGNVDAARGHGHSGYFHNSGGSCVGNFKHIIMFNSYGFGVHAYGVTVAINDMNFDQIISFNAGVPAVYPGSPSSNTSFFSPFLYGDEAASGPRNGQLTNSYLWQATGSSVSGGILQMGIGGAQGDGMVVSNIYCVGGYPICTKSSFTHVTGSNNKFINTNTGTASSAVYDWKMDSTDIISWNNNEIYDMRDLQSGYRTSFTLNSSTIPGCCRDHLGGGNFQFKSNTTLTAAIGTSACDSGANKIPLADASVIFTSNTIKIDNERISVNAIVGNDITNCTRGAGGTAIASHSNGAVVGMIYTAGSPSPTCTDGSCNNPKGVGWLSWTQGLDSNTPYHGGSLPTTTVAECFANQQEVGRGHCIAINWANTSTVTLDFSGLGFTVNDTYAIWDVQNFTPWDTGTAIKTGTYTGALITGVPFSSLTTVIKPIGSVMTPIHTTQSTSGKMATYVVRRTSVSSAPPAPAPGCGQRNMIAVF